MTVSSSHHAHIFLYLIISAFYISSILGVIWHVSCEVSTWQKISSFVVTAIFVYDINPYKDSAMSNTKVIVILLQFILACAPLAGQAAALDQDNDLDKLGNIDRELVQDCLKQRDSLRVKSPGVLLPRDRVRLLARLQPDDLLQELLAPEVIGPEVINNGSIPKDSEATASQGKSREYIRQENLLLKEFTAETSNP